MPRLTITLTAERHRALKETSYRTRKSIRSLIEAGLNVVSALVILGSLFGAGCDYLVMSFAPSLAWLFVGRVISGITAASFGTAFAYIAAGLS